jgi:hypothetical protein
MRLFENAFTGIFDVNGIPICEGSRVKIIDKDLVGTVRYSIRRAGFRIFFGNDKPQNDKTYSVANSGKEQNMNLEVWNSFTTTKLIE